MTPDSTPRGDRASRAFHAGLAAEDRVALDYQRRGYAVLQRRWRGAGGEIDLIVEDRAGALVFIEVKHSRTLARAAARVSARQARRIVHAAEAYAARSPLGSLTDMRFDVALMDGTGALQIIENALEAM